MRSRHLAGALAATLLAAGTVVAGGSPAAALDDRAPVVDGGKLDRSSIVVGELGFTKPIRFTVRASDNRGVTSVVARLHRNDKASPVLIPGAQEPTAYEFTAELLKGTAKKGVWTGLIFHQGFKPVVGSYTVRVFAVDGSFNHSARNVKVGTYRARWDTRIQNVAVTPVQGKRVTVTGLLQHIGPNDFGAFGGAKVTVQFRGAGASKWRTLTTVKTGKAGRFKAEKLRGSAGGQWRAVFAGDKRNVGAKSAKAGVRTS